MIIDLLNNYSPQEQNKILDIAKRWYIKTRKNYNFYVYKEFPYAPYWGDGNCEHGECEICPFNNIKDNLIDYGYDENGDRCEQYSDSAYEIWFDKLVTKEEEKYIEEINLVLKKQIALFDSDEQWRKLDIQIGLNLFKWLNDKNITYCLIKGLLEFEDNLYYKGYIDLSEVRLRFDNIKVNINDKRYAVEQLGWKNISLLNLTNRRSKEMHREIVNWIADNRVGVVIKNKDFRDDIELLFEDDIDIMAIKLKWFENEY